MVSLESRRAASEARRDGAAAGFATTCWTLIRSAQEPEGTAAREQLYRRYWKPVAAFLARLGVRHDDLEDTTQGFFLMLEERNDVVGLDPKRGRFRSWLRVSARHYLLRSLSKRRSLRAGGRAPCVSLDAAAPDLAVADELRDPFDPEQLATQREAFEILSCAERQLRNWYAGQGKLRVYDEFAASLHEKGDRTDLQIASRLGKTTAAVRQERLRMRARFAECVKAELRCRGVPDAASRRRLQELEVSLAPDEASERR